jgi:predicted HTH transcriptional regulator
MLSPRQTPAFKRLCIYHEEKNLEPTGRFVKSPDPRRSGGEFNHAACLPADENGASVKVAACAGADKVDPLETREHGGRRLIAATRRILDRLDSENRAFAKITAKNRLEKERANTIAPREAVTNAVVRNDRAKGAPLVEIFTDRVAVASRGGPAEGLGGADFFKCRPMPRNRELTRAFRDTDLAGQTGSVTSRILKACDRPIFELAPGFTAATFPFERAFVPSNDKIIGRINEKTRTTPDAVKENPAATIPAPSEPAGKPPSAVSRGLKEWRAAGLPRREGAGKKGRRAAV